MIKNVSFIQLSFNKSVRKMVEGRWMQVAGHCVAETANLFGLFSFVSMDSVR